MKSRYALVTLLTNDSSDVLQVVKEHFSLLLLFCILIEFIDFSHIVELLVEVLLGVYEGIEQVAVLAVLLRLEVERVKELKKTLSELSDLYIGWA